MSVFLSKLLRYLVILKRARTFTEIKFLSILQSYGLNSLYISCILHYSVSDDVSASAFIYCYE